MPCFTILDDSLTDREFYMNRDEWAYYLNLSFTFLVADDPLVKDLVQRSGQEFSSHLHGAHHTTHPQRR